MKKICLFLFLRLVFAQVIPPGDPAYIYLWQDFRQNHDLDYFIRSFPYSANRFPTNTYSIPEKGAYVRVLPGMKVWGGNPVTVLEGWGTGYYNNWTILVMPVVVPEIYGEEILGAGFTRFDLSGRFTNSLLRYAGDRMTFQLGRGPMWWGQSWESSIIQSGNTPPYDHADLRIDFGDFQLELLAGQLGSEYTENQRIKRNIAGHRLTWIPDNKRWLFGFGEQVIYTGVNRGFEWVYLNPAIPYVFTAFEGEEESGKTGRDNDNSIIFAYGRYVFRPDLSAFFEFILDDYQIDKNDVPNALGWKVGMDGGATFLDRDLTYGVEYTRIDSWTYIHHGEFTTWQNLGHPIGYRYGPDNWSLMALAEYWLRPAILFKLKYTYLEKGANTLRTKWASPGTRGDPFPTPPVDDYQFATVSLAWFAKYGIIEAGWSNEPFAYEIANSTRSPANRAGVYLKAQLVWGFGFDVE